MKQCGVCGAKVADDVLFCPTCGSEIRSDAAHSTESHAAEHSHSDTLYKRFCANCGAALADRAKFCAECGTPSGEGGSAEPQSNASHDLSSVGERGTTSDDRTMAMLIHLSTFAGFLGIPFANIIAPLVIWLIQKDKSPFVDFHGKEAINFQISLLIYGLVTLVVGIILAIVLIGNVMLFLLIPALFIFWIVAVIVAAIKASQGELWEYPLNIRFLK